MSARSHKRALRILKYRQAAHGAARPGHRLPGSQNPHKTFGRSQQSVRRRKR